VKARLLQIEKTLALQKKEAEEDRGMQGEKQRDRLTKRVGGGGPQEDRYGVKGGLRDAVLSALRAEADG
jgi:hypothetical protein